MSQNDLAALTGIPQSTISAIENDRVRPGVERAGALAGQATAGRVLKTMLACKFGDCGH
ncbi:MAG: helix-turn-helix transcriptional regulator [Burkholderiaceae bacterium]|nr:helix-turn-helix transcriptional regulator [Burkholderiaceae bacterium]